MEIAVVLLSMALYVIGIFFVAYKFEHQMKIEWYGWIALIIFWWMIFIAILISSISGVFYKDWEDI